LLLTLNNQINPGAPKFRVSAYSQARNTPYGYVLPDLSLITADDLRVVKDIFDKEITVYLTANSRTSLLVAIMILKKLHESRHLFSVLGTSKPPLRKAILKHGIDKAFINLISELCINLTEGNVHLPEGVRQQTRQPLSTERVLACKNRGNNFKRKRLLQAGGSFFTLLLPIIAGLVNSFL
jgi:hypothetical protein